ncbi:MAG: hypothetical protein AB1750_10980 [Chloroflexota bacterium]
MTIGLIAAMTDESAALLRHIQNWKRVALGPLSGYRFDLPGQTSVLVTSGMGVRRAGKAARALIESYNTQALISFGIAGAVEPDLEIGDVIAAESYCQLEAGALSPRMALASLPDAAKEAIHQALTERGARLLAGVAITTGGAQFPNYAGMLEHPILEMETAGIARVAAQNQIPLFSLRAISDGPRAPIPFDLGEIMDADANLKIGRMARAVVRNPKALLQSGRVIRNARLAAENAAVTLIAALSRLSIG